MRLNRHDEGGWRAIARSFGVSEDVAARLWQRAEAEAGDDLLKAEQLFRRMVEETTALDAIAEQIENTAAGAAEPGKSTRVLDAGETASPVAEPAQEPAESGTTSRLRKALLDAVSSVETAATSMAGANAQTINEALRRFMRGQGKPLISVDDGALVQVLRLADALVTIVEQGRAAQSGKPLPEGLRNELETKLGTDFSDLRVHDDDKAAEQARSHDAVAFAKGKNVYFSAGSYDPSSSEGRELIAHEATHVAQQRDGGSGGGISAPGSAVEREADRVAAAFAAGMSPGAREFAVTQRAGAGTISRKGPDKADPAAAAKTLTLKSTTTAQASSGGSERYIVGVGEEVKFEEAGGATGDWTATGGTPASGSGPSLLWNAPGTAGQFEIKLKTPDGVATKSVAVVLPTGVKFTVYDTYGPDRDEMMGAGMRLDMQLEPLTVSFNKITIREKPGGAHGLTGYFKNVQEDLAHKPDSGATKIREDNKAGSWDDAHLMDRTDNPWPRPLQVGSMAWHIPYLYSAGDVTDAPFSIVQQTMGIVDSKGTVTVTKGAASTSRTPTPAVDDKKAKAGSGSKSGRHVEKLSGKHADKLSGDTGGGSGAAAAPATPKAWNVNIAGMALDVTGRMLGDAHDNGDGTKTVQINQTVGPLKITSAKFKQSADGSKVESGTLSASIESGALKGTTGSLTVNSAGKASGKLDVQIEAAKFLKKKISLEIGDGSITGKATVQPSEFAAPDFPVKTSEFDISVEYKAGSGIEVSLTGSASVSVENGFAKGAATMDIEEFKLNSSGVSFRVKVSGKVEIQGLAEADAVMKYDGKNVTFEGGSSKIAVNLPGIEGSAIIEFAKGKLSLDSKDLHFTLPQLKPINFESVHLEKKNLAAKLSLAGEPVTIPLPGGASLAFTDSSIEIDGKLVNGNLTGTFKMPGEDGFSATANVHYVKGGGFGGSVTINGGAEMKFGGVDVSIKAGSKLTIEKNAEGLAVDGDITGTVKVPGLDGANITAHVIAKKGEALDLDVDANVPINKLYSKLGGQLNVKYKRGGGAATAFSFKATDISYSEKPINGQVIFSEFEGKVQGKEITGGLTAKPNTHIKTKSVEVVIVEGYIKLLPGKKLHGNLHAGVATAGASVEAKVGWNNNVFTWEAEAEFDLGALTSKMILGKARVAADSGGAGSFKTVGDVTFGMAGLEGVKITELSGSKEPPHFVCQFTATEAVNKALEKVPSVDVKLKSQTAKIDWRPGKGNTKIVGEISGSAAYPKTGAPQLSGDFHLQYGADGFKGTLDKLDLKVSEYFKSHNGSADLNTGDVQLPDLMFEVPGFASGKATAAINVKDKKFDVHADIGLKGSLAGVELHVEVKNDALDAHLKENAPPIKLGNFATFTVGAGTNIHIGKTDDVTAHVAGKVDAPGLGDGTVTLDYKKGAGIAGAADINVKPFAMFNGTKFHLDVDSKGKVTTDDILLELAPDYSQHFAANATVKVTNNEIDVTGKVTELKNLGKVSEAFKKGGGATIKWNQKSKKVTLDASVDMSAAIPELADGSTLKLAYDGTTVSLDGTLKPGNVGANVTFTEESAIHAHWDSSSKKFTVKGSAKADIKNLATAEFTVDANAGGGDPAAFVLKGKIDATSLSNKIGKAVHFSSVEADFSIAIGGGEKRDLNFHLKAAVDSVPAAGITDIAAHLDVNYKAGEGIDGELAVTRARIGDVDIDGKITVAKNKFSMGTVHIKAAFPSLDVEGTGTIAAGDMGELNTSAELKVTPGGGSVLAKFIQSGSIKVDLKKWKLESAVGKLLLKTPDILPIENTVLEIGYAPATGISATLSTQFNSPMGKGEKGTFVAGYTRDRGLFAHVEFPIYFPGFQRALVTGDLDKQGLKAGVELIPKDAKIIKKANIDLGYDIAGGGLFIQGSLTLAPTEALEFVVGVRYSQKGGLEVLGIDSKDKDATSEEHEVAKWKKNFPTIPLLTVGVASLGLKFGLGVAAGYRMPKIKFDSPKLEGGLEALDQGGMPAFTFGGSIAMGAYLALSLSVQVVGEIQLLIATCSAGIGAEIMARLNLELGADVKGRFAPGQGATLQIDPFVGASLDLIASLIATLYAEVCWFTIVDKKWTLASAQFAHIDLGQFRPFKPLGVQIGGPEGTHLTQGLELRDDAFDQITEGVKEGGKHAGDEEANRDAREKVTPVLQAFKTAAPQFAELPPGWENGLTVAPVNFSAMFSVGDKEWDYYQDNADTAETVAPAMAMSSPTERLAKAVGIMARRNPFGAGQLVLAWRRAQIAHKGINPDTGVDVVAERETVQREINEKYQADLLAAQEEQRKQDEEYKAHVLKQGSDYTKAQGVATKEAETQKVVHEKEVAKAKTSFTDAQEKKAEAAKTATKEGAQVEPVKEAKAPAPPAPPAPPPPKKLDKPAPIPVPPPVPLPPAPEILPTVALPALPTDPGSMPRAAMTVAPQKKPAEVASPGVKEAPKGGAPDPKPGAASSTATQAGGGGGGAPMPKSSGGAGGAPKGGGSSAAAAPAPAVKAGPEGIINQQKTLDAKEKQVVGDKGKGTGGKPGTLGKVGGGPAPAGGGGAPPAPGSQSAGKAPGAPGPGADAKAAGGKAAQPASALDPTVQKVADAGKADQKAYDQKLDQQAQQYDAKVKQQNQTAQQDTKKLEAEAAAAKKKKEEAAKAAATAGPGAKPGTPGAAPGTPGAAPGTPGAAPGTPGAAPAAPALPPVPTSLVVKPISAKANNDALERALLGLKGSQEFGPGGDAAAVTKTLLASHPDAKMAENGALTLPSAQSGGYGGAASLSALATDIIQQLGVSKVKMENVDGKSVEITVGINPEVKLGKLEPQKPPVGKKELQAMASAARAVINQNDAALKAQMLNSPTKIKRIIVGAGYASVATYVTLPESERQQTIGIGFADPWALRGDLLMGQTAEYLQVAGFPSMADFNVINAGGYLPSSVFADVTALARAEAGMAVFAGWAGQSENFDSQYHQPGGKAVDLKLQQEKKKADDEDVKRQIALDQAKTEQEEKEKRIKPVVTADEHNNQKAKAKGDTLIIGAGAAASWNVEKTGGAFFWLARPAAAIPGYTPAQPRGEILLRESYLAATGGGSRNDGVLANRSKMFIGEAGTIDVVKPGKNPAAKAPIDHPGANPAPPQRTAEQAKEPWDAPAAYKLRVPINTGSGTIMVYTQNLDLAGGPGPARKLHTVPEHNPDNKKVGDQVDPARPDKYQMSAESGAKGEQLALPEDIEVQVSTNDTAGERGAGIAMLGSKKVGQVVLAIGADAYAHGGINDLIIRNKIKTTIIWDRAMSNPATEWQGDPVKKIQPASPLGVECKEHSIRVLGAAATDGPGLSPEDNALYKKAQNAHLGRLADPGGRAEGGISRLGGTFQAANAQLDGKPPVALPNAGQNTAPIPSAKTADGKPNDKGTERKEGTTDPNFTPPLRQTTDQKNDAFDKRMDGYKNDDATKKDASNKDASNKTPPPPVDKQKAQDDQKAEQQKAEEKQKAEDKQKAEELNETELDPIETAGNMQGTPHTLTVTKDDIFLASHKELFDTKLTAAKAHVKATVGELNPKNPKKVTQADADAELEAINADLAEIKAYLKKHKENLPILPTPYKPKKGTTYGPNLTVLAKNVMTVSERLMAAINKFGKLLNITELEEPLPLYPSPTVGEHPVTAAQKSPDNLTPESHHVPNNELYKELCKELISVGKGLKSKQSKFDLTGFAAMGQAMVDEGTNLQALRGAEGEGLAAILLHRITHQSIAGQKGTAVHSKEMAALITKAIELEEDKLGESFEKILTSKNIVAVKPTKAEWRPYVKRCKAAAAAAPKTKAEQNKAKKDLEVAQEAEAEIENLSKKEKAALERIALEQIGPTLRTAFNGAYLQTYNAVKSALALSRVDGPEAGKNAALAELRKRAQSTWEPLIDAKFPIPDTDIDL